MEKQKIMASMTMTKKQVMLTVFAEILEINSQVEVLGKFSKWQMDKHYLRMFFYYLDKGLQKNNIEINDIICHFAVKKFYDNIYGKTVFLSIPLSRILIHLSKIDIKEFKNRITDASITD